MWNRPQCTLRQKRWACISQWQLAGNTGTFPREIRDNILWKKHLPSFFSYAGRLKLNTPEQDTSKINKKKSTNESPEATVIPVLETPVWKLIFWKLPFRKLLFWKLPFQKLVFWKLPFWKLLFYSCFETGVFKMGYFVKPYFNYSEPHRLD